MARVFIPQHPWVRPSLHGPAINYGDLSPAFNFGAPIFMTPVGPIRHDRLHVYAGWISRHMEDFTSADYVLMVGDSMLQGMAVAVALLKVRGTINVIRGSAERGRFQSYPLKLEG